MNILVIECLNHVTNSIRLLFFDESKLYNTAMNSEHTIELRVRYDECDPMGFVHHANYMKYFEIARTDLYRARGGSYRDFEATGLFVVVVKIECKYQMPSRYDDLLTITVKIDKITEAKIVQSYIVKRDEQNIVCGSVTLAVIDRDGKLQRIPDSLRNPLASLESS
jgi:acyl-CoA thioester hydrolase